MTERKKKLGIGVIGVGNIGFVHASSVARGDIEGAVLAALCDCRAAMTQDIHEHFPGIPFETDYQKLLQREDVDAVIVSVPHPMHAAVAMAAFAAGKHVLIEKPMDIALSRGRALCEAARKSGKKFGIMFNQRTGSLFAKARSIVRSGLLGQLKRSVWIITNWYRTQYYYDSGTWRATWDGEGGGVLMNQAPHQLDLWQWICGMPERITGFCTEAKYHNIQVEDEATILARFPGGAEGVFITSTGEYPGTNRLEISGSKGKLVLENGLLKWWQLDRDEREFCYESQKSFAGIPSSYQEFSEETGVSGHRLILQNFTNAVLFDEELIAPGYDGINELTIQNAAYLSAWQGNVPVELPLDEALYDALLAQKQETVHSHKEAQNAERKQDYSERWQIKW